MEWWNPVKIATAGAMSPVEIVTGIAVMEVY
jgi:hypothetical protein